MVRVGITKLSRRAWLESGARLAPFAPILALGFLARPSVGQETEKPCGLQLRVSRYVPQTPMRRVLVVTPQNLSPRFQEQDTYARAIASSMQHCLGIHCSVSSHKLCFHKMPRTCGSFDEQFLVMAHHRFGADAVLYCEVTSHDAYAPPRADAHLLLVDVRESIALFEVTQTFDLDHPAILSAYQRYLAATASAATSSKEIEPYAPTEFLEFCARTAVSEIASNWKPAFSSLQQPSLK